MPGTFCTQCGFENQPTRGACLMCLNYLHHPEGGSVCPSCGTNNPREARFCRQCGNQFEASVAAVPARAELVARVIDAVGGLGVSAGGAGSFADDDFVDDDGFAESVPAAMDPGEFGAADDSKVSVEDIPAAAIPGPVMEPVAAAPRTPPGDEIEPDEDFSMPPPGVVATLDDEDDLAPPPPPGVVAPPPPPAPEEEDDFAPPPPPGIVEPAAVEDGFAPPPPPPGGFVEPPEDDFAPPPPPGIVEPPADAELPPPPPPPPGAEEEDEAGGEKQEDEDNGGIAGWELDFKE